MNFDKGGKGNYEKPETGPVLGVCFRIIEMGTHKVEYPGSPTKMLPKVLLSWEIDQKKKDGKKFVMSKTYTQSLHEKARLRIDLESWRGKKFSDDDLETFNETNILGKPCLLTLVESKDGQYINIGSISPIMKGMETPQLENQKVSLELNQDNFKQEIFDGLHDNIKAKIMLSPEWAEMKGNSQDHPHTDEEPPEEETPF